jgi:hypothetical protein
MATVVSDRALKTLWVRPVEATIDDVPLHGATVVGITEDASTPSWEAGQRQAALVEGYLQRGRVTWDGSRESTVFLCLPNGTTLQCQAVVDERTEPALGPVWTRVAAKIASGDTIRVANILRRAGL